MGGRERVRRGCGNGKFYPCHEQTACVDRAGEAVVQFADARVSTRLFYRSTRRVSVTEVGQIYYQHCLQVLDALEQAGRFITDILLVPLGRLRLTAPVTYGEKSIAPLVNNFVMRYPELDIEMDLSNQILDLVAEGYDLAVRLGKLEDSSLIASRLASRTLYVLSLEPWHTSRPV